MSSAANVVIAIAVLALILSRQLRRRTVRESQPYRIVLILGVVGLVQVAQFQDRHDVGAAAWGLLAASLLVGVGFGALRGRTVHVWREDRTLYRQGNAATLVLWIVGLALHLGVDLVIDHVDSGATGLGGTAVLLYLAVALGAQQLVVLERAEHLA